MSIVSIPNQPFIFGLTQDDCRCVDDNRGLLVDNQDQVFMQFELLPCENAQQFFQGTSNLLIWQNTGGSFICNNGTPGGNYRFRFEPDEIYTTFQYTLEVVSMNSGTLFVEFQGGQQYEITTAGTYILYFNSDIMLSGNLNPYITLSGDSFNGCFLDGIIVNEQQETTVVGIKTDYVFSIVDLENIVVYQGTQYKNVIENIMTIAFDFAEFTLDAGCYKFALADSCINTCGQFGIVNGQFTSNSNNWTLTSGVEILPSLNQIEFILDSPTPQRATNGTLLCVGKTYYVEFTIVSLVGAPCVNATIDSNPILQGCDVGTYSALFTPLVDTFLEIRLVGTTGEEARVSDVICRFADNSTFEMDSYSNVFSKGSYTSCDYVKIEGCNGDSAFGFQFNGSNFLPGIRLKARYFRAQYDVDAEFYRSLSGVQQVAYADRKKYKALALDFQSELVWDFLSVVIYFDTLFINGNTFFPKEEAFPSISYADDNDLGSAIILFETKTLLVRKVKCSNEFANCLPTVIDLPQDAMQFQDGARMSFQDNVQMSFQN